MKECCCIADDNCKAPANLSPRRAAEHTCYCCGQAVCSNCSLKREYLHYGKVRLCNNCNEQEKK